MYDFIPVKFSKPRGTTKSTTQLTISTRFISCVWAVTIPQWLQSPRSLTFRSVSDTLLLLFYSQVFKKKKKKKKSALQNRIQQTRAQHPSHSFLEKSVGLKAWSCLTCIISPSTHQSITVLLCVRLCCLKFTRSLMKSLKPQRRENRKAWVAQTDLNLK